MIMVLINGVGTGYEHQWYRIDYQLIIMAIDSAADWLGPTNQTEDWLASLANQSKYQVAYSQ